MTTETMAATATASPFFYNSVCCPSDRAGQQFPNSPNPHHAHHPHYYAQSSSPAMYNEQQCTPAPSSSPSMSSTSSSSSSMADDSIDRACRLLGISADPYNWNQTDVRKWLMYQQRVHQLMTPMFNRLLDHFEMDGMSLCELDMDNIQARIYESLCLTCNTTSIPYNTQQLQHISQQCASIFYNQLNIWRTAISTIDTDLNSFFECNNQTTTSNAVTQAAPQQTFANDYETCMVGAAAQTWPSMQDHQPAPNSMQMFAASTSPASLSSASSCSSSSSLCYSPIPSPPSSSNHNNDESLNQIKIHQTPVPVSNAAMNQNNTFTFDYGQQQACHPQACYYEPYASSINQYQPQQHLQTSDYGSDLGGTLSDDDVMSDDGNTNSMISMNSAPFGAAPSPLIARYDEPQHQPNSINYKSSSSPSMASSNRSTNHSASIQLWQFLKELLSQPQLYGNAIRWLERSKGVFKIEDSVRVARLWGERKNRPAMNYDKLSRSIRQYYKKGIMKKTERAQRLVYQFCQPYCL